jgi:hypothetical protein
MSPITLSLDLLLVVLLLATLGFGMRLDKRLKGLKDSHADFAKAVADLDQAAQRAEAGLAQLRGATEEAVDLLAGRIEKGRELAAKLERLTVEGGALAERAAAPAEAPRSALDKLWTRPTAVPPASAEEAISDAVSLVKRLSLDAAPRPAPRPTIRRPMADDDLFDSPTRAASGASTRGRA